jgi:accessory gene regulator protein AgrB
VFVLHRMACWILKTFFDLSAYLAENTVSRNNSYWVLTSFVAMANVVQLARTKISDKEILKAKLRTAERVRDIGRSVATQQCCYEELSVSG